MGEENRAGLDLWGDPFPERQETRGRKRHKRDPEIAELVAVLSASDTAVVDIALRVNLSEPTLRKYYLRELEHGAAQAQAALDEVTWRKAKAGVVGAVRLMGERFQQGALKRHAANMARRPAAKAEASSPKPEVIGGKKAQRQQQAEEVAAGDNLFGTRRGPSPDPKPN